MRSKWATTLLASVFAAGLLPAVSGCTARFGEDTVGSSSMGLGSDTKCLSGGSQVIADYYQGHSDEKKISGLWDCASRSLKLFAERTRGEQAGVYSSQELKIFLEDYFLDEYEISDAMMEELMALKRTLLGGAPDSLTVGEVQAARKLMEVLRDQSLKLRPYLPLTAANYAQADGVKVAGARRAIDEFVREISNVLTGTGTDYEFSHIAALMREFESTTSNPRAQDAFHAVRDYLPMLQQLKAVLISPDATRIASRDWEPLLNAASQWFGLYLHAMQVMGQSPSIIAGEGREQILGIAGDVIAFLEQSIERRPGRVITTEEFKNLIEKMDDGLLLMGKSRIQKDSLKKLTESLLSKVLGEKDSGGLTRKGLARLRQMLGLWSEGQNYIDQSFLVLGERPRLEAPRTFRRSEILGLKISEVLGGDESVIPVRAWRSAKRVRDVIARTLPLYSGTESSSPSEISLAPAEQDPAYSYRSLTFLHLMDLAAEIFIDSYALEAPDKGVSEAEFRSFYADIQELAGELRIIDPKNKVSFLKRFAESNLFLAVSNGDGYMSREETALMLSYSVSAKAAGWRMHLQIAGLCNREEPRPIEVDSFGNETIDGECYRREFFRNADQAWVRMPGMRDFYKNLSAAEQHRFEENFNLAARNKQSSRFITPDSEGYMGLAQYIESFFARFDRNHDGVIEKAEALSGFEGDASAFQVLRQTLSQATCKLGGCVTNEFILKSVFTYLLAHGEVPSKADLGLWMLKRPFWSFRADRGDIAAVLANLSKAAAASAAKAE